MPRARHDRGQEIGNGGGAVGFDRGAVGAGAADDLAAANAAAGQDRGPGVGEVIAAPLRIDARRPAELAHPHDQGGIEQAALAQVLHQGAPGRVEDAAQTLDGVEVLVVRVPAELAVDGAQA